MPDAAFVTRDGSPWVPSYLLAVDPEKCIGCGRCYKVCPQDVLTLMGINDEDELVDPFDEDEEIERKVMTIGNEGACIGCTACARVCGSGAQTHGSA